MMEVYPGKRRWFFPDLFWPEGEGLSYMSHEAICVLNCSGDDAILKLTLYYEDKAPVVIHGITCGSERTNHIRMDKLIIENGEHLPRNVGYAAMLESSVPVAAQYTRVDLSQGNLALMTCVGYGEQE